MKHKSGFVNIIGPTNVGKSTLINSIIGKKISIVSHKNNTTIQSIVGIFNKPDVQIVFTDTPGMTYKNKNIIEYNIQKFNNDVDVVLLVTEFGKLHSFSIDNFYKIKFIPTIILINKIDKITNNHNILYNTIKYFHKNYPFAEILPISAIKTINVKLLIHKIIKLLNNHPPFYPKEYISNKPIRFFLSEIIREKIFFFYHKELPYISEVKIDFYKKLKNYIYIYSSVFVNTHSQKNILTGKMNKSFNRLLNYSRNSMKKFLGENIYLEIKIKIKKKQ